MNEKEIVRYAFLSDFVRSSTNEEIVRKLIELDEKHKKLKEENEKLKQWDNNKDSRNSRQRVANAKLLKENQQLKKDYNKLTTHLYNEQDKRIELKERIDKATDYIEKCNPDVDLHSMFLNESYISNYGACELLKVLRGKDDV